MSAFINQFHFLMPHWFALLIPAYGYLLLLHLRKNKAQGWQNIVDDTMQEYVVQQQPDMKKQSVWIHALAVFIAVFAISGPSWTQQPQPVFEEKSALIIAIDLSLSMLAEDVKPNRLSRAKFIIDDVVNSANKAGQFSLIAFAQEAFIVTPFTTDKATLINQIRALTPQIMPFQGTNFSDVIEKAEQLHTNNELEKSRLLIITDTLAGLNAAQIQSNKVDVSILAISLKAGAPIPTGEGDFIKDANNNIVISQLNSAVAKQLQAHNTIRYRQFSNSDKDLAYLLPAFKKVNSDQGQKESAIWVNQGHYFIWLLLPYFLLWFRKGVFYGLVFFVLPLPQADAFEMPNWLLNDNQTAQKAYQNKQYQQAAKLFTNPNWLATSLYKSGQYEQAEQIWKNLNTAQSNYNAGNAAAQQKQYKQAITHYKNALKKQADFKNATANLASVKQFLKQQQKQKEKQQKDGDKKDQKQDQKENNKQQSDEKSDKNKDKQEQEKNQSEQQSQKSDSEPSRKQSDGQKNADKKDPKQQNALDKKQKNNAKKAEEKSKGSTKTGKKEPNKKPQQTLQKTPKEQKQKSKDEKEGQQQQQLNVSKQRQLNKTEQWLQQIPDDPGGLLRRKFYYYSQQHNKRDNQQPW